MKVRHAREHRHTQMNTKDAHTRKHTCTLVIQLSMQCSAHTHTHMYVWEHTVCTARQRHIPIETYIGTETGHSQASEIMCRHWNAEMCTCPERDEPVCQAVSLNMCRQTWNVLKATQTRVSPIAQHKLTSHPCVHSHSHTCMFTDGCSLRGSHTACTFINPQAHTC